MQKYCIFFCIFSAIWTSAKALVCVNSTENSDYNEKIFLLVTLIYSNLDKRSRVLKFKEFISLNNSHISKTTNS